MVPHPRILVGALLLVVAPAVRLRAQCPGMPSVIAGAEGTEGLVGLRVRLQLREPAAILDTSRALESLRRVDGIVRRATDDSVVVARDGCLSNDRGVAWREVHRMHVRRARVASPARTLGNMANAGIGGALLGAGAGAIAGLALSRIDAENRSTGRLAGRGAVIGAGTGLAIGTVVGLTWSRGVWVRVPLPSRTD